ncbi:MAG TPA: cadmium-translocating P-type ATPase [Rhizobiales bacterium]|nr:cadmium-translocating P-type ATPase [Hyphomicrobiales bacterium]
MAKTKTLLIDGMDCPSCTAKIEGAVCNIPGIENVSLNYTSQKLKFELAGKTDDPEPVVRVIEKLGYKVKAAPDKSGATATSWWQTAKGRLVIAAGSLLVVAAVLSYVLPAYSFIVFSMAALIALYPLARKAIMSAIAGQPFTIEMLVTIAVTGAIFINQAAEAAVVVFLFLIGELLEMIAAAKARRSVEALADLVPKSAFLVTQSGTREVAADSLRPGDIIEVRPGGRVPADGKIIEGDTSIDEAAVTGESMPKRKQAGDRVFAGSINNDGLIRLAVEKGAEDNMIARILTMVEEAEASKAPTARFIDRFSRYYTPGVIVVSALIAFVPPVFFDAALVPWIYKGLAILLIGCPCALVLSTPAAITSGISAGARRGLLLKGGGVLETIGRVKQIAFDKTGTLTRGKPQVTDIVAFSGTEKQLLQMAGGVEAGSSHPLAQAVMEEVGARGLSVKKAAASQSLNGRGVEARVAGKTVTVASPRHAGKISHIDEGQRKIIRGFEDDGKTVAVIVVNGKAAGAIAFRDELRSDAASAMQRLKELGILAIMLTGDNARTGRALAARLGMDVKAELLPQDKLEEIKRLQAKGKIAMVGDGINDAPALAIADAGIAMGGGTDVALETADAAILHEQVGDVPALISLSRATMRNIYQNITIALGLKAVFLVTTILGMTSLWMAILADTGATVLVTINALRLLGYRFETQSGSLQNTQ